MSRTATHRVWLDESEYRFVPKFPAYRISWFRQSRRIREQAGDRTVRRTKFRSKVNQSPSDVVTFSGLDIHRELVVLRPPWGTTGYESHASRTMFGLAARIGRL